jgi:hypothetical protein
MKVINHNGIELNIGDRIKIISEKLGNKVLANVNIGEVITITGFSEDSKILYHHNVLALPVNSNVYKKL